MARGTSAVEPGQGPAQPVPVDDLLDRLISWGFPIDKEGFTDAAAVDMGEGIKVTIGLDHFVEVFDADGDVMYSGHVVFTTITDSVIKGAFVDIRGIGVHFAITPQQGLGSTWGFVLDSSINGVDVGSVWFDYFQQTQTPVPVPIPVPNPPRKGNRVCVCLFTLPDGPTDWNYTCSAFDCNGGKRCQGKAVAEAATPIRGSCQWVNINTDPSGFAAPAVVMGIAGAVGALGVGLLVRRRRD